jgi:hypothetical protein
MPAQQFTGAAHARVNRYEWYTPATLSTLGRADQQSSGITWSYLPASFAQTTYLFDLLAENAARMSRFSVLPATLRGNSS